MIFNALFISSLLVAVNAAECSSPIQFAPSGSGTDHSSHGSEPGHYMIPTPGATKAWRAAIEHLVDHPQDLYALLTISYNGQPIWQLQRKAFEAQNTSHTRDAYENIFEQCFHPGASEPDRGGMDVCPKAVYNTGVWSYEGQWFWAGWWPFNAGAGERRSCREVKRDKRDGKMSRRGQLAGTNSKEGDGDEDMVIVSIKEEHVRRHELPYPDMFARKEDEPVPSDLEQLYHVGWVEVEFANFSPHEGNRNEIGA